MSELETTTQKWINTCLQFSCQEGADVRPEDHIPLSRPPYPVQNQKRMLMKKRREPMRRPLEQVATQGFLSERSSLGS